jgi:hypothetical protein
LTAFEQGDKYMNENQGIITLEDENGTMVDMTVVDMVEYSGEKYVLLQSTDENDEVSYIFKFTEEADFDRLESVEDEEELRNVAELFEQRISDSGYMN